MISNLVFDMGQVLLRWTPELFTASFQLPKEEEALLVRETFDRGEWQRLDEGTLSMEEAIGAICARLPEPLHPCVEQLVTGWWDIALLPVEGMGALIGELKAAGYGIYLLSNAAISLRQYFFRLPGAEHFDGLYVSAEHRLLKPQPEIYESFFKTFSLTPESCFFTDDREENIAAARAAGMEGVVFQDAEQLRRALLARRILRP